MKLVYFLVIAAVLYGAWAQIQTEKSTSTDGNQSFSTGEITATVDVSPSSTITTTSPTTLVDGTPTNSMSNPNLASFAATDNKPAIEQTSTAKASSDDVLRSSPSIGPNLRFSETDSSSSTPAGLDGLNSTPIPATTIGSLPPKSSKDYRLPLFKKPEFEPSEEIPISTTKLASSSSPDIAPSAGPGSNSDLRSSTLTESCSAGTTTALYCEKGCSIQAATVNESVVKETICYATKCLRTMGCNIDAMAPASITAMPRPARAAAAEECELPTITPLDLIPIYSESEIYHPNWVRNLPQIILASDTPYTEDRDPEGPVVLSTSTQTYTPGLAVTNSELEWPGMPSSSRFEQPSAHSCTESNILEC